MAAGKAGGQGARGPAHVDPVTRPCLHGLPTLVPPSVWLSSPRTVNRAGHEVNRAPPATSTLQGTCPGQAQWSGSLVVPVCGFASRELTVASPAQPPWTPAPPAPARTREHGMLDLTKRERGFPGSRTHSLHVRPAQAGDLIDAFHALLKIGGREPF